MMCQGEKTRSGGENPKELLKRYKGMSTLGILTAASSGVFLALGLTLVKICQVFPLVVLLQRSILQVSLFLCILIYKRHSKLGIQDKRSLLYGNLSAIFGALFPVFCHAAMFFIPVADVIAIFFASPAFITLFNCVVLKENPGIYRILILGLSLSGVLIVTKPVSVFGSVEDSRTSWLEGCLLAISSSISYSGFCISCNYSRNIPAESINLMMSGYTIIFTLPILGAMNKFIFPFCGWSAVWTLASMFAGIIALFLLVLSTKLEKPGPVSIANTAELPAIIVFQILLTSEMPTWHCYLGSALIVSSVFISGWLKIKQEKQNINTCRDIVEYQLNAKSVCLKVVEGKGRVL